METWFKRVYSIVISLDLKVDQILPKEKDISDFIKYFSETEKKQLKIAVFLFMFSGEICFYEI